MNKKLPVYKLTIDKDDTESGVFAVALVNQPAMEIDFFAFSAKNKQEFQFKEVGNPDKQLLAGYLLVPDKLIYRCDNGTEYFVTFDAPTIELIAEKFNKSRLQNQFNKEHNPALALNNVFVKENWMVESTEFDKCKSYGFDAIVGGWFGVVKVDDLNTWQNFIKTGILKGFSVEGNFAMNYSEAFSKPKLTPVQAWLKRKGNQ